MEHVHLGPQTLLFTDQRLLHLKTQTLSRNWQAEWVRFKGVDISPEHSRVSLLLFSGSGRERIEIECEHPAAMHLVYDTIRQGRELHAQAITWPSCNGGMDVTDVTAGVPRARGHDVVRRRGDPRAAVPGNAGLQLGQSRAMSWALTLGRDLTAVPSHDLGRDLGTHPSPRMLTGDHDVVALGGAPALDGCPAGARAAVARPP